VVQSPSLSQADSRAIATQAAAEAAECFGRLAGDSEGIERIAAAGLVLSRCLQQGGKVLACGNGGSMSDAIHLAEELSGRFRADRRPLAGLALSDPGHLTCVANDQGFEQVFARSVEALGRPGDVLVVFSTSGSSPNVLVAASSARRLGMDVVALTGKRDSALEHEATVTVVTPGGAWSDRVQELHALVLHTLIEIVERALDLSPAHPR
jgi:D-sedoheptulose 7-phosphate isomerase